MDEFVLTIGGVKYWLWRAVDQTGMVLDILVQSRRDTRAAKRLLRKLLKRHCRGRGSDPGYTRNVEFLGGSYWVPGWWG